ncbi:MAG TPA: hypothetical protein VKE29_00905 [Candidatus Udaeobacter sp.]|nr:hypothetical protein [Candidatus Udaeobacter sp.]
MKCLFRLSVLLLGSVLFVSVISAQSATDPIYVKVADGWKGLYGHGNEYAEFHVKGDDVKLQDAYHVLLGNGVGLMVSFVDKKELRDQKDLLSAHAQWEIDYWHEHASKVESNVRRNLMGSDKGLKVTEIRVFNDKGARMSSYLVGLAANDGVFVLSVSPARKDVDPVVKELVSSFKLVHQKLDPERVKNLASKAKAHD